MKTDHSVLLFGQMLCIIMPDKKYLLHSLYFLIVWPFSQSGSSGNVKFAQAFLKIYLSSQNRPKIYENGKKRKVCDF